jgi:6-phosphogluconolactonase
MDDLRVFADAQTLAEAAADLIVDRARCAIEKRGWFHFALAGGSTPEPLYRLLTQPPYRSRIDWSRVHIFLGRRTMCPARSREEQLPDGAGVPPGSRSDP